MKKQTTIIISALAITMVVSGCATKKVNERKPVVNNQVQNQGQPVQVATSTTSEVVATSSDVIDTSDWKTYKNDEYGIVFDYSADFNVYEKKFSNNIFSFEIKNLPQDQNYGISMRDEHEYFGGGITFEAIRNSDNISYNDIIDSSKNVEENGLCKYSLNNYEEKVLVISQCSTHSPNKFDSIGYVIKNGIIYSFGYGWHEKIQSSENEESFNSKHDRYYQAVFDKFIRSLRIQTR